MAEVRSDPREFFFSFYTKIYVISIRLVFQIAN